MLPRPSGQTTHVLHHITPLDGHFEGPELCTQARRLGDLLFEYGDAVNGNRIPSPLNQGGDCLGQAPAGGLVGIEFWPKAPRPEKGHHEGGNKPGQQRVACQSSSSANQLTGLIMPLDKAGGRDAVQ